MEDLTGVKFGKFTVTGRISISPDLWQCVCECGRHRRMSTLKIQCLLKSGEEIACGFCRTYPFTLEEHKIRLKYFKTLNGMKGRCYNINNPSYKDYGGRGITICDEWRNSFEVFYNYVSNLAHFNEPGRSLDRIDNDKWYFPGNVRWATAKEQANNKRPRKGSMKNGKQDKQCTDQSKSEI